MKHKKEIPNIEVQDLDHLGIIAGIIDDIQLVTIINQILGEHPPDKISSGHAVKALILNCMGFLTAPLYLFHQFFVGKATQHLIGKDILPSHLNARRIEREVRQTLENKKGKQTQKPTLRWLLQCCYLSVHLVWVDGVKRFIKLNDRQRRILKFLSPNCQKYYLLS